MGKTTHKTTHEMVNYQNPLYASTGFNHPNTLTSIIPKYFNNPK